MKFLIISLCIAYASALVWRDCGTDADRAVKFNDIYVRNEPITLPGQNAFNGDIEITKPLSGDMTVKVQIWKKVWVWVKIPCISKIGSCSYGAGCDLFKNILKKANDKILAETCPDGMKVIQALGITCAEVPTMQQQIQNGQCPARLLEVLGIPCIQQCPVPALTLKLNNPLVVDLPALPDNVPSLLAGGTYGVQVELIGPERTEGCLYAETSLQTA